jgi:hypothetical protein
MKNIKLTLANGTGSVFINPNQIGHYYRNSEKSITKIGVTTHNNGGFEVMETLEQINKLIEKL